MNNRYPAALAALSAVLLAACASSGGMASSPHPAQSFQAPGAFELDSQYVAAVEYTAKRRGVRVQWVNPPQKRVPATLASARR